MPASLTHHAPRAAAVALVTGTALLLTTIGAHASGAASQAARSGKATPHSAQASATAPHAARAASVASPLTGRWKNLSIDGPQPAAGAALAWDSADGVLFAFGGGTTGNATNDLWAYRPAATKAGPSGWTHIAAKGDWPDARAGASAVWDSTDGVLLLFDGQQARSEMDSLWAYKPGRGGTTAGRWTDISGTGSPMRRAYQSAVWDSADGVMLVVGGESGDLPLSDAWTYRPAKGARTPGTWTRLAAGPPPRQNAMAVWDSADRLMLLAGGVGYSGLLGDLWAFRPANHGSGGDWTRLAATTPLGARAGAAAAWDSAKGRLLIFGGQVPTPPPASIPVGTPATISPTRTVTPTMTPSPSSTATSTATHTATPVPTNTPVPTDTATNTPTNTPTATDTATSTPTGTATATDTATASATSTVTVTVGVSVALRAQRIGPNTQPSGAAERHAASTIYPAYHGALLLANGAAYTNDLWSYTPGRHGLSAGSWKSLGGGGPSPRSSTAVYDDKQHALLLFGGQSASSLGDLWTLPLVGHNSGRWSMLDGGSPQARTGQASAWDARDGVLFVFGGFSGTWLGDLWAYKAARGAAGHWTLIAVPYGPDPRTEASLVWDSADNALLLFGGADALGSRNDVWAYKIAGDGTAMGRWTLLTAPNAPLPRHLHTAVWDDKDRQMLVYAGETTTTVLRDLWSFRLTNLAAGRGVWSPLMAQTPPAARFGQAAVWDAARRQMLVFGGVGGAGNFLGDLWAYRPNGSGGGTAWANLGTPGTPDGRATAAASWDPVDNALIVFGGTGLKSLRNDSYAYTSNSQWRMLNPASPPDRRNGATAVFDTVNGGVLLFGGAGSFGAHNDLWQLGGMQSPPAGAARSSHTKKK